MDRRLFLENFMLISLGVVSGIRCGDEDSGKKSSKKELKIVKDSKIFPQSVVSGDPKEDSVILWTRVFDEGLKDKSYNVVLRVGLDAEFKNTLQFDGKDLLSLKTDPNFDSCLKVKLKGLKPFTHYYYQFIYQKGEQNIGSNVGKTKTAPAKDSEQDIKFVFASCQRLKDRYYNVYNNIVKENPDFLVFLGDYIYEYSTHEKDLIHIKFSNPDEAIKLEKDDIFANNSAAKTLNQYRELYQQYRGQKVLQKAHESFPFIVTWDDHEFSDDSHGASGTYLNCEISELDEKRRKMANKAFFEYMPVDYPDNEKFKYDESKALGEDIKIYRDFRFGKHMHLVMTDLRSYRSDHPLNEDAFPGFVFETQEELEKESKTLPGTASPYIEIEKYKNGYFLEAMKKEGPKYKFKVADFKGNISVKLINSTLNKANKSLKDAEKYKLITDEDQKTMKKGLSIYDINKTGAYSELGSRYFCFAEPYERFCNKKYKESGGKSENCLGSKQEDWFFKKLEASDATWKIWGTSYCLGKLELDFRTGGFAPEPFNQRLWINMDDWTGLPNNKKKVLDRLAKQKNVIAITGDIHAFFANTPFGKDLTENIFEFVTGSISSPPFQEMLEEKRQRSETLRAIPEAKALVSILDTLLRNPDLKGNPQMAYSDCLSNGYNVVSLSKAEVKVQYKSVNKDDLFEDFLEKGEEFSKKFTEEEFLVKSGDRSLYKKDGTKWNPKTFAFE